MADEIIPPWILEAANKAKAVGAGAADEMLFGVPSTYVAPETFKGIEEKNPAMYTAGRVGSYFIPGLGELKSSRKVLCALRSLEKKEKDFLEY